MLLGPEDGKVSDSNLLRSKTQTEDWKTPGVQRRRSEKFSAAAVNGQRSNNCCLMRPLRDCLQISNKPRLVETCHVGFTLPSISGLVLSFFSFFSSVKVYGESCVIPCFSMLTSRSAQLCWTEIGSWAFSFSEQEVGAGRHRAGWLPLPYDSPGSFAVCVNTLFLPSSPPLLPAGDQQWASSPLILSRKMMQKLRRALNWPSRSHMVLVET